MGSQMWADLVKEYVQRIRGYGNDFVPYEYPFTVLQDLVAFKKLSKGRPCEKADEVDEFPKGVSYYIDSYMHCWLPMYRLPLYEFGFDTLRKVISPGAFDKTTYKSKTDRMAALFCKATKHNMIPLFKWFNTEVSPEIAKPCESQPETKMITNYLKVAKCIMEKDIMECVKMKEFPEYKGICRISGTCNQNPDEDKKLTNIKNEFDRWGSSNSEDHKPGIKDTARKETSCLSRAKEIHKWCNNDKTQSITTSFTKKDGTEVSFTYPKPVVCGKKNVACKTTKDGASYAGTVNTTKSHRTCQPWNSDKPHRHNLLKDQTHNYCRNPDGEPGPWCYTTDPDEKWELCDIRDCEKCDHD